MSGQPRGSLSAAGTYPLRAPVTLLARISRSSMTGDDAGLFGLPPWFDAAHSTNLWSYTGLDLARRPWFRGKWPTSEERRMTGRILSSGEGARMQSEHVVN